jgi:selenocysteine-specific elongation factor
MKVTGQNPIAFVDVPGHEKLVRTMIAGASGIDFALILIAADDGVMPQTREHLSILSLLGLSQGAVVITKSDKVDASLLAQRELEAQQLIATTSLAGSPVCCVSSTTGEGIDTLKQLLIKAQTHEAQQQAHPVQPAPKADEKQQAQHKQQVVVKQNDVF